MAWSALALVVLSAWSVRSEILRFAQNDKAEGFLSSYFVLLRQILRKSLY